MHKTNVWKTWGENLQERSEARLFQDCLPAILCDVAEVMLGAKRSKKWDEEGLPKLRTLYRKLHGFMKAENVNGLDGADVDLEEMVNMLNAWARHTGFILVLHRTTRSGLFPIIEQWYVQRLFALKKAGASGQASETAVILRSGTGKPHLIRTDGKTICGLDGTGWDRIAMEPKHKKELCKRCAK